MLYAFLGTDRRRSDAKADEAISALRQKEPHASIEVVQHDSCTTERLEELLETQGLFKAKIIIKLVGLLEEHAMVVTDFLERFASSEHVVVLVDTTADAELVAAIQEHATKCILSNLTTQAVQPKNQFALSDALFEKDTKQLFLLLEQQRASGVSAEEALGMLLWAAKSMALVVGTTSASESEMKPFVYAKSVRGVQKWGTEVVRMPFVFTDALHAARVDAEDPYDALTRAILSCA